MNKNSIKSLFMTALFKISSLLKISMYVGLSHPVFFSASSCIAPLLGAFLSSFSCYLIFGSIFLLKLLVLKQWSWHLLAYYIPGFCAALAWKNYSKRWLIVLPLMCMILFIMHPVGFDAALYSFYWIIPGIVYFLQLKSPFFKALATTFVAHAVGATIWIYTLASTPDLWLSLIPLVALERLTIAVGITIAYYSISYVFNWLFSHKILLQLDRITCQK